MLGSFQVDFFKTNCSKSIYKVFILVPETMLATVTETQI